MRVHELVEEALARATGPVVVRVLDRYEANLRWAGNALTTNGEMHSRRLSVTATAAVEGGTAVATVSSDVVEVAEVAQGQRCGDDDQQRGQDPVEGRLAEWVASAGRADQP